MIGLADIHKSYGSGSARLSVLRSVTLDVPAGSFCAITGSSGSGKSTLLNIIGLLDRPDDGSFMFDGMDVRAASADQLAAMRNRRIGFVFQSFHLLSRLTAVDNVTLPFLYRGLSPRACRGRAMEMLERVGLAGRAHHRPDELSGGQRQRVAIARAIVGEPSLLLADEPTGNLDSQSARQILDLFFELNVETGVTVIIVTHDPSIAARCPQRVHVRDGRIVDHEQGTGMDLPATPS
jgi:putative ABC transport system ATP-binding protein